MQVKRISRIGTVGKKRPLMVVLKNENEKMKIISNLRILKGLEQYRGIRITEDLTPEERNVIKELSEEAIRRNHNESSSGYTWRIRGSSRYGFYIKKIPNIVKIDS